jgi:hypothetical protein
MRALRRVACRPRYMRELPYERFAAAPVSRLPSRLNGTADFQSEPKMVPQTSSPQSALVQRTGKSVVQIAELPENNLIARNVRVGKWLDVDWKAN